VLDEKTNMKIAEEEILEDLAIQKKLKAERDEQEYDEWYRKQFNTKIKAKVDMFVDLAQNEFEKGSYSESITQIGKPRSCLRSQGMTSDRVLKKSMLRQRQQFSETWRLFTPKTHTMTL